MKRRSLRFESFTLDLERLSVHAPSGQLDLRPKSFEVLRYLTEHAGRVVTKDEVIKAVWPDVTVTDESLTRCISEVRHALGDERQRIIKTVPRRGYLFDTRVSSSDSTTELTTTHAVPNSLADTVLPSASDDTFVGGVDVTTLSPDELVTKLQVYRRRESAILDIFGRINSGDNLTEVFRAVISHALRLCEAKFGMLLLFRNDLFTYVAGVNVPEAFENWCAGRDIQADPTTGLGRLKEHHKPVHIEDICAEDAYRDRNELRLATADLAGARTFMAIPIINEGRLLGAFTVYRQAVLPFNGEQIELVQAFAFQAALALANAQLVKDLEARRREFAELNAALEHRVQQQVQQIERYGRLRRFMPPQLADLMLGEHPDRYLESHRREVAVLSCDLRGFTALSEGMEPELVMGVLKEYHACIGTLSETFEATLERFAGDSVMLLFNDPLPCPNPAERAVRMAVALRHYIGALAESWRKLEFDIGVRVGVAYGYATLGQIGFEGRYDYAAIGPIPSLASGLCDNAADGQILISQRVLAAVRGIVEVTPLDNLQLRGFARPVRAHNVVCLCDAGSEAQPAAPPGPSS